MIGVKVNVRLGGVKEMFDRLSRIDTKRVLSDARGPARFDLNHHDRYEEGPDGKWPALAPSTVAAYARRAKGKRRRGKPHKLLGRLPRALVSRVTANKLTVLSRVTKWSMAHQAGGIVGRGSRLPRRQFMWISDWLKGRVKTLFEIALRKAGMGSL